MQLLVEPDNGVFPILNAIHKARRTIDMHIFRLAYKDIEKAIAAAVRRGVVVRTLIAHTSASGEKALRKLEQRLLQIGATVSRTADDLVRYHGKMVILDNKILHVYGFNYTGVDIEKSRSFGVVTKNEPFPWKRAVDYVAIAQTFHAGNYNAISNGVLVANSAPPSYPGTLDFDFNDLYNTNTAQQKPALYVDPLPSQLPEGSLERAAVRARYS